MLDFVLSHEWCLSFSSLNSLSEHIGLGDTVREDWSEERKCFSLIWRSSFACYWFAQSIQHRSTFSLFIPVLLKHWKVFWAVLDVPFFLFLSSRCALTFLTPSLTCLDNESTFFLCSLSLLPLPLRCLCISAQSQVCFKTAGSGSIHVPRCSILVLGECCPSKLGSLPQQIYSSELPSFVSHLPVPWRSPKFGLFKPRACTLFCYLPSSPASGFWAHYFIP